MSEYDSILKEEKKYEEPAEVIKKKKKHFPYLMLDVIFIMLILIISYLVYYRTVLAPDKIFAVDMAKIVDDYKAVFKYFPIKVFETDYYYEGTISFDDEEYNYGIIRNKDKFKIDLSIDDDYLLYYLDDGEQYIKLSNWKDDYIKLNQSNISKLDTVKENVSNYITEDKYIKSFYLDGYIPVVEMNLVLKNDDISSIVGIDLEEQYEVLFTFKNNAFTNEIINMKMVINNLVTNKREVITYQGGEVKYFDGEDLNLKFVLNRENEDFTLKIYRDEILYSVLSGTKQDSTYQYMYQVIDQIYNISLGITEEDERYLCELVSNIEEEGITDTKNISITLNRRDNIILDSDKRDFLEYDDFTKEEKRAYKEALDVIIGNLRQLINKYQ